MSLATRKIPGKLSIGDIIEEASVTCVDEGVGMSLALPFKKNSDPFGAYAHISQATDGFIKSLSKSFKIGSTHRCRILAFNMLEGVAVVTLKESVIEQQILSHSDVAPGMVLEVTVAKLSPHGMKVQLTDSISGFVPQLQLSDKPATENALLKFAPGQTLKARVLTADPVKRSVILTLKKTMIKDENPLTSFQDAVPGEAYYGCVSSVSTKGLFVTFFNEVFGMVRKSELDMFAETGAVPKIGATIKVWLKQAGKNNRLMFGLTEVQADAGATRNRQQFDTVEAGDVCQAVVTEVQSGFVVVSIGKGVTGIIPNDHLSDHSTLVASFKDSITTGTELGDVLVLEKDSSRRKLVLTRKVSLVSAAQRSELPVSVAELEEGHVYPGFIKNVTKYGAFVGFLNGVSGLAHKRELADRFVSDPDEHFSAGNSVSAIVKSSDDGKLSLSLKTSECPVSPDAPPPVVSFFADRKLASELAAKASGADEEVWKQLALGSVVDAQVMSVHSYGVVTSLLGDVVGFIKSEQLGGAECEAGDTLQCRILDIAQDKAIVDLSLKLAGDAPGMSPKKRKRGTKELAAGSKVSAVVELVKDDYLVVSLPDNQIGFALSHTFNDRVGNAHDLYALGQKLKGRVVVCSEGRVLLQLDQQASQPSKKNGKKADNVDPAVTGVADIKIGMLTKAKVVDVTAACVNVLLSRGIKGRIHSSHFEGEEPEEGAVLSVRVLSKAFGKSGRMYELSALESVLSAEETPRFDTIDNIKEGKKIEGYVESISEEGDSLSIWINPQLKGRMMAEEASKDIEVASNLAAHFAIGQKIKCVIAKADPHRQHLDLSMLQSKDRIAKQQALRLAIVTRNAKQGGLYLRVAGGLNARAYLTDLSDKYCEDPMNQYSAGQIVQCRILDVLSKGSGVTLDVTLRKSQLTGATAGAAPNADSPALHNVSEVKQGDVLQGYVKSISTKGCFVGLSKDITARVKLADLADGFVDEVAALYPVGKLVKGRIQSVDAVSGRIDMSLKKSVVDPSHETITFEDLQPGMILRGTVKKVEDFGVFVNIDESELSGLCHLSEVSEQYVKDVKKAYSAGDQVKVAVLRVNNQNKHISLSMKSEHFEDESEEEDDTDDENDEEMELADSSEGEDMGGDMLIEDESEEEEEEEEEEDDEEDDEEESEEDETAALPATGLQWDGFEVLCAFSGYCAYTPSDLCFVAADVQQVQCTR